MTKLYRSTSKCDCVFDPLTKENFIASAVLLAIASLAINDALNVAGSVVGQTATGTEFYDPANAANYHTLGIVAEPVDVPDPVVYPFATGEAYVATRGDYYADQLVFAAALTAAQKDTAIRALRDQNLVAKTRV